MRTTLSIDDDLMEIVSQQAKLRGTSLGRAVSEYLRKGLAAPASKTEQDGLVMFALPHDTPTVTTDDVRRLESEGL
jgi:CTP:molybdopterin cytidylyltransferase MocA